MVVDPHEANVFGPINLKDPSVAGQCTSIHRPPSTIHHPPSTPFVFVEFETAPMIQRHGRDPVPQVRSGDTALDPT